MSLQVKLDAEQLESFTWLTPYIQHLPETLLLDSVPRCHFVYRSYDIYIEVIAKKMTCSVMIMNLEQTCPLYDNDRYINYGIMECFKLLNDKFEFGLNREFNGLSYPPSHPIRNYPMFQILEMAILSHERFITCMGYTLSCFDEFKIKYSSDLIFSNTEGKWPIIDYCISIMLDGTAPDSFFRGYDPIMVKSC